MIRTNSVQHLHNLMPFLLLSKWDFSHQKGAIWSTKNSYFSHSYCIWFFQQSTVRVITLYSHLKLLISLFQPRPPKIDMSTDKYCPVLAVKINTLSRDKLVL